MPFLIVFSIFISCDEDEKKLPFKYSHLGLHIIQTDKTALGGSLSVPLPGSLYVFLERRAEEIDNNDYSYERIINAARIGVHAGIADVLSSISSRGIKIIVKNIFDVYAELGIKSSAYENDINSFSEDDAKANVIAGIRFGNPIGWEGKLFIDFSKAFFGSPSSQRYPSRNKISLFFTAFVSISFSLILPAVPRKVTMVLSESGVTNIKQVPVGISSFFLE